MIDLFFWIGLAVFLYYSIYLLLINVLDCDVTLKLAELFGKPLDVLKGNVIWITGASSGIGEHLAVICAKHGAKLVLSARRKDELERVKCACIKNSRGTLEPSDILILPMDVTEIDRHGDLFDSVLKHFGKLDILVNNAGRSQRALWQNINLEVDRSMFDLNVFSLINLSRIAVRYFAKQNRGHIAVTSSTVGLIPVPFSATYVGAKHALHGYFNALRTENMNKNLTVTLYCPGPTFTNFLQECYTDVPDQKFGQTTKSSDKRMTGERCAYLFAVSIANKLNETWAALHPLLTIYYLCLYHPFIYSLYMRYLGKEGLMNIRDSRQTIKSD